MTYQAPTSNNQNSLISEAIKNKLDLLRNKVLDLSSRNPLISINVKHSATGTLRVIDELPDVLADNLTNQKSMKIVPLPALEDDPLDERTVKFRNALKLALSESAKSPKPASSATGPSISGGKISAHERRIRNQIREKLGLPKRPERGNEDSLKIYASDLGFNPNYDLPLPTSSHQSSGHHSDKEIQTLMLPEDLEKKLGNMQTKCRTFQEETGLNVFFAVFGLLYWSGLTENKGLIHSPILLLPLKLEKKKTRRGFEFSVSSEGEDIYPNFVLAQVLKTNLGLTLPDFEPGQSVESYLKQLTKSLAKSRLGAQEPSVKRQVLFGLLPYDGMAIYNDLDFSRRSWYINNPVIRQLLYGAEKPADSSADKLTPGPLAETQEDINSLAVRKNLNLVLSADSSQVRTIIDVIDGRNLVVEGPPGTGKSQTIVNTIAEALSKGQKVLFIAEKLAALEVVKSRLEAVNLGEFLLPLQANRSNRAEVIESIRARLTMRPPSPIDSERQGLLTRYANVQDSLERYKRFISFKFGLSGLTIYTVLGRARSTSLRLEVLSGLKIILDSPGSFDSLKIEDLIKAGDDFMSAWQGAMAEGDSWQNLEMAALNEFIAQDILALAAKAADHLEDQNNIAIKLNDIGIDINQNIDLEALAVFINIALKHIDRIDKLVLISLIDLWPDNYIKDFFAQCQKYQSVFKSLAQDLTDPEDRLTFDSAKKISAIAQNLNLGNVVITKLGDHISQLEKTLSAHNSRLSSLAPLMTQYPKLNDFTTEQLCQAGSFAASTGRLVLALRSQIPYDPIVTANIERILETSSQLLKDQKNLEALFPGIDLESELGPDYDAELLKYANTLERANFWSFLNSEVRTAKGVWKKLTSRKIDPKSSAQELRALAKWRQNRRAWEQSSVDLAKMMGQNSITLKTDLDLYRGLIDFYHQAFSRFSDLTLWPLRQFVLTAETDLLLSLPKDSQLAGPEKYDQLVKDASVLDYSLSMAREANRDISNLNPHSLFNRDLTCDELKALVVRLEENLDLKRKLDSDARSSKFLATKFRGSKSLESDITDELACLTELSQAGPIPKKLLELILNNNLTASVNLLTSLKSKIDQTDPVISELSEMSGLSFEQKIYAKSLIKQIEILKLAAQDRDGLFANFKLRQARLSLTKFVSNKTVQSFGPLMEAITKTIKQKAPIFDTLTFGQILEAVLYRTMAETIFREQSHELIDYIDTKLDDLRGQLADYDKRIIESNRKLIRHNLFSTARPPQGRGYGPKSEFTDLSLLQHEITKKKAYLPLRKLLPRAAKALMELKPCWMMSPTAVSQYLDSQDISFDLCILDEASQMPPENAVASLARSQKFMIVGDSNQLPPTTFFKKHLDDDSDSDLDEDNTIGESILEMAQQVFQPHRRLLWHYRSRHSALIEFSNRHIYQNTLVVYPSPSETRPDMGVRLVKVEGLYQGSRNEIEAQAMVDAAVDFMHTYPDRSLGLVTLNQKQMDLINEKMERVFLKDSLAWDYERKWSTKNDGLEKFFVKNLENVQGDERDAIFIGTVYGPEKLTGPVANRFGPIVGIAGRRRLNVLFSRAKESLVTFTSMVPDDIKSIEGDTRGVAILKAWLGYAAKGGEARTITSIAASNPMSLAAFVAEKLIDLDYIAQTDIGTDGYRLDVAIKHPHDDSYILGLETDGPSWFNTPSIRDRDRLRDEVLKGLGWNLYRLWSANWFNQPDLELARLKAKLDELLKTTKKNPLSAPKVPIPKNIKAKPQINQQDISKKPARESELSKDSLQYPGDDEEFETDGEFQDPENIPAQPPITDASFEELFVQVGDIVKIQHHSSNNQINTYYYGNKDAPSGFKILNPISPLGKAIKGAQLEDEVEFKVGSTHQYATIIEIIKKGHEDYPAEGKPPKENIKPKKISQDLRLEALSLIDTLGPIKLSYLMSILESESGAKIIPTSLSAMLGQERPQTSDRDNDPIYYPSGSNTDDLTISFRGLDYGGYQRSWSQVPHLEKLDLAQEALLKTGPYLMDEAVRYMAETIGQTKIAPSLRYELEGLFNEIINTKKIPTLF
ncbi:MAG: DUF4011 domain-containing protein [Deltaproteobacteria bacterium]|jgi:very-short-patch-repair endonuclease|nr:DUF4011 domain-containing protein [Deltaproteobacteria bacterium]